MSLKPGPKVMRNYLLVFYSLLLLLILLYRELIRFTFCVTLCDYFYNSRNLVSLFYNIISLDPSDKKRKKYKKS